MRTNRHCLSFSLGAGAIVAVALLAAWVKPAAAEMTTSQLTSLQLNQLFLLETTPNKSAAGEGYVTASFDYLSFHQKVDMYKYQAQGQYSFTNQLAVGGIFPIERTHTNDTFAGLGDIAIYGQYKLDQIIPHDALDVTAQFDVVFPTGDRHEFRDTGRFGVRPAIKAFKDFGEIGPGHFGAYADLGFTISADSDIRWGFAVTYDVARIVGILEFYDEAGDKLAGVKKGPIVALSPGFAFHPDHFEFAVGFPIGLNQGTSPNWGVVLKATYGW